MMRLSDEVLNWGREILRHIYLPNDDQPLTYNPEKGREVICTADRLAGGGKGIIDFVQQADDAESSLSLPLLSIESMADQPLESIFTQIYLNRFLRNGDAPSPSRFYIPPKPPWNEVIYPQEEPPDVKSELLALQANFQEDVTKADEWSSGEALLVLLEKYGSTLPSVVQPHVPLYEHLKLTAAIADCMTLGEADQPFLLVMGDLSGIQDFVYGISSYGALRSLRSRSFLLEFLLEHTVSHLLESLDLSRANIIFSGGGNFCLLLPNCSATIDGVNNMQRAINNWFFHEFEGQIYLAVARQELAAEDLGYTENQVDYGAFWREVTNRLEEGKRRKFQNMLIPEQGMCELFQLLKPVQDTDEEECQICHRDNLLASDIGLLFDNAPDSLQVCSTCSNLFHLGNALTDFRYILRWKGEPPDYLKRRGYLKLPDGQGRWSHYILSSNQAHFSNGEKVWRKNSFEIQSGQLTPIPFLVEDYVIKYEDLFDPVLYPNTKVPLYGREVVDIEETAHQELGGKEALESNNTVTLNGLATAAFGGHRIAAASIDVDNLGLCFSIGLQGKQKNLAHHATLSRYYTYFFKLYLNWICEANEEKTECSPLINVSERLSLESHKRLVSVIYSGGDDLFMLGAWSDVAEVIYDIQQCFDKFTGASGKPKDDPHRRFHCISAGVILHHPKYPLYQIARASKAALQETKQGVLTDRKDWDCVRCCGGQSATCGLYQMPGPRCNWKNSVTLFFNPNFKRRVEQRLEAMAKEFGEDTEERMRVMHLWDESIQYIVDRVSKFSSIGRVESSRLELLLSRGFLRKLFSIVKKFQERGVIYLPQLRRLLVDMDSEIAQLPKEKQAEAQIFKKSLEDDLCTLDQIEEGGIKSLHIPLTWMDLLIREKDDAR